jgi:hypothetical protein
LGSMEMGQYLIPNGNISGTAVKPLGLLGR